MQARYGTSQRVKNPVKRKYFNMLYLTGISPTSGDNYEATLADSPQEITDGYKPASDNYWMIVVAVFAVASLIGLFNRFTQSNSKRKF